MSVQKAKEESMIDLAFTILSGEKEPMEYRLLMERVFSLKGFTPEEVKKNVAYLYTDINTDGRFICISRGMWGLRNWYPMDRSTDSAVAAGMQDDLIVDEYDPIAELTDELQPDLLKDDILVDEDDLVDAEISLVDDELELDDTPLVDDEDDY